jgi:hypothetical protein
MIFISLLLQISSLFLGYILAQKILTKHSSNLTFEQIHSNSKVLWFVTFIGLLFIFVGAYSFHNDDFFLMFPLLYQKYAMVITWVVIIMYLAFLSGFTLSITHKLKKEKFKTYLIALVILNILLLVNHEQKNAYDGMHVKGNNTSKMFTKQSTNFSCTSASVATLAKTLDINVSEKKVAQLSRLTKRGANAGQVRFALNKLNIKYHSLTQRFIDPNKIKAPAILYVDNPIVGFEGHAIVYLGKGHYGYEIWNPVGLHIYLSEKELRKIWHGRGIECF